MKVLIVDDEIQIRKGLRLKVDWEEEGFQIVEEASNGRKALDILQTEDIDVVITDMRMPIMDGVELAKRCHQEFPHVKVIVLSGYSDFEYVRNSLQQGVKDYLLKPVAPDELVEALRKIRKEVAEEKRKQAEIAQMSRLVHSHLQELQEQFILHLAKEEVLQLPIVTERLQQLQLEELATENGKVQFITVEIRESNDDNRLEELRLPFQLLCKEIAQQYKATYVFTDPSYPNMVQLLMLLESNSSVDQFVQHIQLNVNKLLKLETVIGIGAIVNGLSEYRSGYISSLLAWSQSQLGSKSQIMDQTAPSEELFDFSPDFEKRITNSIENLDFAAFKDYLKMVLEGRSVMSFSFAANQVLFMLGSLAKKYDVETNNIQNMIWNCQQNIWKLYSQHKVKEDLIQLASLIIEKVRLARFSNKKLIDSIRHYLDQHYASEISLTTLSALFHINSAHLSETFKNHVGQNFSDYLVTLRMDKAKQLLKDKQLKIIDVSNLVGFSNSGYFSTVFKKHFGQTPVEFRNSIEGAG
ncbi:response regulator [Neobacillus sp. DY30]|uniref:response regulator transcription factor n=1 Tax=Neobacillus sp. DY30 TaxID=3047871 RepID=UPI0024BFBA9A|nr:response regulator [Neobacillus sp. DY30]WHY00111.1 response regulator [Neobacillus sp. DY30]